MCAVDDAPGGFVYAPLDQLRHDLKTPLTTIHARAQLLDRAIRRVSALSDEERGRMLEGVTVITSAVHEMVALIDSMSDADAEGRSDTE